MDREDKLVEMAVDALITRTQDLKQSLAMFIYKLENEYETLTWPSALDSFALLSGQINNLMKVIKSDKTPSLRNRILLPLIISPDVDEDLMKLTEGRVQMFNHEMVPDYLRTKLEPDVEQKEQQLHVRANQITADQASKQITSLNKIVNNVIESVKSSREDWEAESGQRSAASQTSSINDTTAIIQAITTGKALKGPSIATPSPNAQAQPVAQATGQVRATGPGGKVTSIIKTNIKAANSMHPYR